MRVVIFQRIYSRQWSAGRFCVLSTKSETSKSRLVQFEQIPNILFFPVNFQLTQNKQKNKKKLRIEKKKQTKIPIYFTEFTCRCKFIIVPFPCVIKITTNRFQSDAPKQKTHTQITQMSFGCIKILTEYRQLNDRISFLDLTFL